ncbi:MAG: glycosyltransferase [Sphingobacteriales bacterium]|nr:MAG: glycosyltransferase [Sphingobacteriales bacterium]
MAKKVSIVIPVYNEEQNIDFIAKEILAVTKSLNYIFEIIFIDDGSRDNTLEKIQLLSQKHPNIFSIELTKNFGHQNALKAGYDYATGHCIISMDGDMQHPPELISLMLKHWENGFDIVSTQRTYPAETSFFKKSGSNLFYKIINTLSDTKIEKGSSDFRLIDRHVANTLKNLTENSIFMRGLINWLGFKSIKIAFNANQRHAGVSKYPFKKMLKFAVEGITAFSVKPLYMAVYLGFIFSTLAILYIPYVIYEHYLGKDVAGWATVVVSIVFFGGLQLIILGIIGIYIGKLFIQSKQRPNYIVRTTNL